MVALHSAVHDGIVPLLCDALFDHVWICPVREPPQLIFYQAKLDLAACMILHGLHESLVKVAVVQHHVRVVEPSVKMPLERLHRLYNALQVLVSRKEDNGSRSSRVIVLRRRVETAFDEDLVVLIINSSATRLAVVYLLPGRDTHFTDVSGGSA